MASKIHVVGIGPGSKEYLPPIAVEIINKAEVLFGGQRALNMFKELPCEKLTIDSNIENVLTIIQQRYRKQTVVVLVSGDPGFFSLLSRLKESVPEEELNVIPGISSVQLAFARIRKPWHNMQAISLHGRDISELEQYLTVSPLAILCDKNHSPQIIARYFLSRGITDRQAFVFQNLSYPEENIVSVNIEEMAGYETYGNALVVIT